MMNNDMHTEFLDASDTPYSEENPFSPITDILDPVDAESHDLGLQFSDYSYAEDNSGNNSNVTYDLETAVSKYLMYYSSDDLYELIEDILNN